MLNARASVTPGPHDAAAAGGPEQPLIALTDEKIPEGLGCASSMSRRVPAIGRCSSRGHACVDARRYPPPCPRSWKLGGVATPKSCPGSVDGATRTPDERRASRSARSNATVRSAATALPSPGVRRSLPTEARPRPCTVAWMATCLVQGVWRTNGTAPVLLLLPLMLLRGDETRLLLQWNSTRCNRLN
ncbi:unnamed protein product [Lampetra planeri]